MSPPDDLVVVESVRIPSGDRMLEGRLAYPSEGMPIGRIVMAGPHPLLGGHIENNLVSALVRGMSSRNVAALAFNYRDAVSADVSPGNRHGKIRPFEEFWTTSHVAEERQYAEDFQSAVGYLGTLMEPGTPLALVGYSFGCSILPQAIVSSRTPLVLIAPTVGKHDYGAFHDISNPILVISSNDDFAADTARITPWFDRLTARKQIVRGDWDNHFFRGHEQTITEIVGDYLCEQWEECPCSW